MSNAVIGVEFTKCTNINLKIRKHKYIRCFESFKSNVNLDIYKKQKSNIMFLSEKSNITFK